MLIAPHPESTVGVGKLGFREIRGISEGVREDKEIWRNFLRHLKQRGTDNIRQVPWPCREHSRVLP